MDFSTFILLQFLAHVLADYFFQSNKTADHKNKHGFKSNYLVGHIFIVFICSWVLSFQVQFFIGSAAIAIVHYFIDGTKALFYKNEKLVRYLFFIDQLLHIIVFVVVCIVWMKYHGLGTIFELHISFFECVIVVGYLLCLKPANILIKEIFFSSQLEIVKAAELPNAGKLIGSLERILALTFILVGQFSAVGFLIAAKSVLRYKDTDTLKTEYVLIGTMLSFGIAVVIGIIANASGTL